MKLHTILPSQLYQRGNCLDLSLEEKRKTLEAYRITAVANTWSRPDDDLRDLADYYHHPIPDGALRKHDAEQLTLISQILAGEIRGGGRVLVQCHAGRNRSGLLSALVTREVLGISGTQALAIVRSGRPNAVANEAFARYLEGLEAP